MRNKRSVEDFTRQLDNFANQILPTQQVEFLKKITLETTQRLVENSPVKTGRFRGNWYMNIGSPTSESTEETDKSIMNNISKQRVEKKLPDIKSTEEEIHINNNLDYAVALEHGYSRQAPSGVIGVTVQEMAVWARNERNKGGKK